MNLVSLGPAAGALALVLAVAFCAAWLMRKLGLARPSRTGSHITVVDSLQIDPRRRLVLISCEGRQVLLALGGGSDILLATWPVAQEPSP